MQYPPFYECAVMNGCGRLHYQYRPSDDPTQGYPIIVENKISTTFHRLESLWVASTPETFSAHKSLLVAAMRCFVKTKFSEKIVM